MDLPINPSVGTYQIHKTPFFRRLHRQDTCEFDRLKQAYDSICQFDEKPLETQVKKIRLGKLLRRIKDTFSSSKSSRLNRPQRKPLSRDQDRRKALAKARQLGIEYSRRNIDSNLSGVKLYEKRGELSELPTEKSGLARRLEYGNAMSQSNRAKLQLTQKSVDSDGKIAYMKNYLLKLKKTWPKEKFLKFLVNLLSVGKLNHDVFNIFEDILSSKNDLYWDLIKAIGEQQQYIESCSKLIKELSELALKDQQNLQDNHMETFDSQTNVVPTRSTSSEIYIRTFRYLDDDEFLPPPSESLLRLPEDTAVTTIGEQGQDEMFADAHTSLHNIGKSTSMLAGQLLNMIQKESTTKVIFTKRFDTIIREMVRKESAAMLANVGSMLP